MKIDPNVKLLMELAKATTVGNDQQRAVAQTQYAQAITLPLRDAVFDGNILFDIYDPVPTEGETTPAFDLSFVEPGTESEYIAYSIPACGAIPYRHVTGSEFRIHTYKVGNSIDACLEYIERARYDVQRDLIRAYKAGFTTRMNRDGWRNILSAGAERGEVIFDSTASAGEFTKRLVSLMMTYMQREGGGNSMSINGSRMTDLYMSPEASAGIREWDVDQLDEITRREVHTNDGRLSRLFGVNFHTLYELGVDREYQVYAEDVLGVTMDAGDTELVVGLDQSGDSTFIAPVSRPLETFIDPTLHRQQKWGIYGWLWMGFGVTDVRKVVLGSF